MTSLTITLPEDLAAKAKAQGLLSSSAIVALLREKIGGGEAKTGEVPGFDPRLRGLVDPALYLKGEVMGDIVAPLDVEWEANQ